MCLHDAAMQLNTKLVWFGLFIALHSIGSEENMLSLVLAYEPLFDEFSWKISKVKYGYTDKIF